jgi:uncharacterized repeat protein (TIGR03803 family)
MEATMTNMGVDSLTSETAPRTTLLTIVVFLITVFAASSARAQNFTVLYTFTGAGDGAYPGDVVLDAQGNLYGSTYRGGSFGYGVVFKLSPEEKQTVIHNFAGGDGLGGGGNLLRDSAGNFYGTTSEGGIPEGGGCRFGCGTVFELDQNGKETVRYAFRDLSFGTYPGDLVRDESGNYYGTTSEGDDPWGAVFKVDNTGKFTLLHQFTGKSDGGYPNGLIQDAEGNLYGTAGGGGNSCGCGVVFEIDKAGKETVLYAFAGGIDGTGPVGGLARDNSGNLYGTTSSGGDMSCHRGLGCGTVFRLDKAGKKTLLFTFTGPDGSTPYATLVRDSAGNIYGTTNIGGTSTECRGDGCGTVFELDTTGKETVLHSFNGADGNQPGDLFLDTAGTLYGAASGGGDTNRCGINYDGCGVVFKLTP